MSNVSPDSSARPVEADAVRIGEVIGGGRHGVVVSATPRHGEAGDEPTASYVLKIPSGGTTLDQEASALRHLAHPNVVALIDGPSKAGALLLERCEQGTLADRTLDDGEAATVLTQLADVLAHIHDLGWIHGDISPGNIGIRSDGSIALLDFAAAQLADGSEVSEGTDDLAGDIRQALPILDIRCAAASVHAQLDDGDSAVRNALAALIERCDNGTDARDCELVDAFADLGPSAAVDTAPLVETAGFVDTSTSPDMSDIDSAQAPARSSGGPPKSSTREFGPRPGGSEPDPEPDSDERRWGLIGAIAAVIVALVLVGNMLGEFTPGPNASDAGLTRLITAGESLQIADVDWDDGVAIRVIDDDTTQRFTVGIADDVAAVADWDCNGSKTLGVYRPATGSWFTFDSWDADSVSTTNKLDRGNTVLIEESNGCATVRVR